MRTVLLFTLATYAAAFLLPQTLRLSAARTVGSKNLVVYAADDDFIDVDFVDPNDKPKDRDGRREFLSKRDSATQKEEGGGMMKKLLNNLPFFKKKEEKKKSEAMSAMETGIDDMFKGTGLVGGIVGGLAKKVGNALLSSMEEAASDVDKLQRTAKLWIERDQACASSIGLEVQCYPPQQSSMSSVNVNGVAQRSLYLAFPVQGNRGSGMASLQASFDSKNEMTISDFILQTNTGERISVAQGPSSGGIIDVEADIL